MVRPVLLALASLALMGQTPSDDAASRRANVLQLTNAERAKSGLARLEMDAKLNAAAQQHADDMARRGFFSHESPEGEGPGVRVNRSGFVATAWAENIAFGQRSAKEVVDGWMRSPGHRRNILDQNFNRLGVGYAVNAQGRPYWVQVFARAGR